VAGTVHQTAQGTLTAEQPPSAIRQAASKLLLPTHRQCAHSKENYTHFVTSTKTNVSGWVNLLHDEMSSV
jgi:hypothetical protein